MWSTNMRIKISDHIRYEKRSTFNIHWPNATQYNVPTYCVLCALFTIYVCTMYIYIYCIGILKFETNVIFSVFSMFWMILTLFTLCMDAFADRSFIYLWKQHVMCRINTKFRVKCFFNAEIYNVRKWIGSEKNAQISLRCSEQTITELEKKMKKKRGRKMLKIMFKNEIKATNLLDA